MAKNSGNFNKIKVTDDILSKVDTFKAIVAPGVKRPTLDKKAHEVLVQQKYDSARGMDDHITIFRVKDKKALPPKEINNHTVQGPVWTPPSSVGFVMGAQSKGLRIWSATKPTNDEDGLLGKHDKPSILARESMSVLQFGWMAREPQEHEKYGNTNRGPVAVFTPPSSPKHVHIERLKSIMDVKASWNNLPISLNNVIRLSTPIPKELTDGLKKSRLTREDLDDTLLAIIVHTKGVLQLISKNSLSIAELNEAPIDVVRELLEEEEVIVLLSDGNVQFDKLMDIHSEYIDGSDNDMREFSFQKLYSLVTGDQREFNKLLFDLKLSINDIIRLYNDDYPMFCAFANDDAISFFQEYGDEINIEEMIEIYHENLDLFYALIEDEENVLQDTGVEGFIERYEQIQLKISEIPEDDPYYGAHDAYDYLRSEVIEDNCPDEFLHYNDSTDDENDYVSDSYEDQENSDIDEDSIDDFADQFGVLNISDDDSGEKEEGYYKSVQYSSDDVNSEIGGASPEYQSDYE